MKRLRSLIVCSLLIFILSFSTILSGCNLFIGDNKPNTPPDTPNIIIPGEDDDDNGDVPGGQEPGEQEPGGQEPGGQEPGGQEPGEQEPGEQEPGGQEPGEQEPGEQEPGEQEPGGQEPGGNDDDDDIEKAVYGVEGFAKGYVSIPDIKVGDAGYYVANNEVEFLHAISAKNTSTTSAAKIIEITKDLNLGYKEVTSKYGTFSNFSAHNEPKVHPTLKVTGISKVVISDRNSQNSDYGAGLMIFSKNGAAIKHASFQIKNSENIIIRNLRFDELWEWDESGDYDEMDWDYFTVDNVNGIWFDHLEFGKSYDGLIDFKYGSESLDTSVRNATFSYLKFDFQPNAFIAAQVDAIKTTSNKIKNWLNNGMSFDDVVKVVSFQKKGFLLGGSEFQYNKTTLTIYNSVFYNLQDRFPRLRGDRNNTPEGKGGDVHIFNCYYDATDIYEANKTWSVGLTNQAVVSTEGGAVGVENTIFKGVREVIKTNQKSGAENYTGKYDILNCRYELDGKVFVGSKNDTSFGEFSKNPFVPSNTTSHPVLEFSWNSFETIPYEYQHLLKDVNVIGGSSELEEYLSSIKIGADSTNSVNWLKI